MMAISIRYEISLLRIGLPMLMRPISYRLSILYDHVNKLEKKIDKDLFKRETINEKSQNIKSIEITIMEKFLNEFTERKKMKRKICAYFEEKMTKVPNDIIKENN